MKFFLLISLALLCAVYARGPNRFGNPTVVAPRNDTYMAGKDMEIKWEGATTGFVNIQLVNDFREVLLQPYTIALGVPAAQNRYVWRIPSDIRSAAGYRVVVWGTTFPSQLEKAGNTEGFTIINNLEGAVTTFKVLTPNAKQPCATNAPCVITWDYPTHLDDRPAEVHIKLFRGHDLKPALTIAQNIPADQKTYTWNVPNDKGLLGADMYISVNAEAAPPAGPGLGDNMGGNGAVFKLDTELPRPDMEEQSIPDAKKDEDVETVTDHAVAVETNTVTGVPKKQTNAGAAVAPLPVAALVLAIAPLALLI